MYCYHYSLFDTEGTFYFPKLVNFSSFWVNCSIMLEPVPAQPLRLRNIDLSIIVLLNKHENNNINKATSYAIWLDNTIHIHCLYNLQLLNHYVLIFYTFDPRTESRIWRRSEWRHTLWRHFMAFIFISNVWIGLYHRHVNFQYATCHGSRDIQQLSLILGWPSYNEYCYWPFLHT